MLGMVQMTLTLTNSNNYGITNQNGNDNKRLSAAGETEHPAKISEKI